MILKKLILIIFLLPTVAIAETQTSWIIPPPYYQGNLLLENGGVQIIEEDKDSIMFVFASKNQGETHSSSLWMTKCFRSLEKGISSTSCLIQNSKDKNVHVLVNANRTIAFLAPIGVKTSEVNYKVDNKQIITSNSLYFMDANFQFKLLSNLISGNKLSYSYKLNQSYKASDISLDGFKENYNFSVAFVNKN